MAADKQNYISLLQASKHCGYSQDYLSLRARQGKLKSVKLGRNWVTTKQWLNDYIVNNGGRAVKVETGRLTESKKPASAEQKEQYLSLHEAAQVCGYTQEYLSLRARQGKLKSVKLGRNWVTTKKWLDEYIINFNGPDQAKQRQKVQEEIKHLQPAEALLPLTESAEVLKQVVKQEIAKIREIKEKKLGLKEKLPVFRPSFSFIWQHFIARRPASIAVCALVCVLLVFGWLFREPVSQKIVEADYYFKQTALQLASSFKQIPDIGYTITKHLGSQVKDSWQELTQTNLAKISEIDMFDFSKIPDLPDLEIKEKSKQFSQNLANVPGHLKFYLTKDISALSLKAKQTFSLVLFFVKSITPSAIALQLETLVQIPSVLSEKTAQAGKSLAFAFSNRLNWEVDKVKQAEQLSLGIESAYLSVKQKTDVVSKDLSWRMSNNIEQGYAFLGGAKKVAGNFFKKLAVPFKALARGIAKIPSKVAGLFKREAAAPEQPAAAQTEQKGLVVLPSAGSEQDAQVIEQIKQSFSDEVRVEPKDEASGIIVPIFREKEGSDYLYIMVPAKEND